MQALPGSDASGPSEESRPEGRGCQLEVDYAVNGQVTAGEVMGILDAMGGRGFHVEERTALSLAESDVVITARIDGELVGILQAVSDGAYFAYITILMVKPAHQRKGIGKSLVEKAVDHYIRKGVKGIHVFVDPGAEAFYRKLGFYSDWHGIRGMLYPNFDG